MDTKYILNMLAFMIIYSFLGWVLESIYKTILQKRIVNSGFLKGPLCPIYGFGAIIMILILNPLKNRPVELFLVSFFILSVWEYVVGVILEKIFKQKYWDYSNNKYNINGRVCLKNSIYWGILGLIFIELVHPFISDKINYIPTNILLYIIIVIYIIALIDVILTVIRLVKFDSAVAKINELGEKIKQGLEELKENVTSTNKITTEKLINELKQKQAKLKIKLYKEAKRLKLAFPSMKSEKISQFLNEIIDFETLKKLIKSKNKE